MEENKKEESPQLNTNLLPAVVKGQISLDMTKAHGNYMQLLKTVLEAVIDETNIQEGQKMMKNLISLLSDVEGHRKLKKEPFKKAGEVIDAVHKEFSKPLEEAKLSLQAKLNTVGKRIQEEEDRKNKERERVSQITGAINQFILDYSVKIASSDSNEKLLQIERLVNLEKANKSKYQEYLPSLIERCNDLTVKIKEQKDLIKQKETTEKQQKDAFEAGDDEKAQELMNKLESIDAKIDENSLIVQQTASHSLIMPETIIPEAVNIKTRFKRWKAELVDQKEAMKKAPELLKVELDHTKANEVLKTLKDTGVLNGKDFLILNGIKYYQDEKW